MLRILRSLAFNTAFILWTFGICFAGSPYLLLNTRSGCFRVARQWGRGTIWLLRVLCGITHRIEGLENIPPHNHYIIACKHQSAWDTAIFWTLLEQPAFILKRELLNIPLFGWYLARLGNLPIDRSGGGKTMKAILAQAQRIADEDRPLVVYPEGTRTAFGLKGKYQPGAAMMAAQMKRAVIPAALNSGACWGRSAWLKNPGVITLKFLPAIVPPHTARTLLASIESAIEGACVALPHPQQTAFTRVQ
jgi:1-acyl-sn-glycerol-3-phosphate acyltransferase